MLDQLAPVRRSEHDVGLAKLLAIIFEAVDPDRRRIHEPVPDGGIAGADARDLEGYDRAVE